MVEIALAPVTIAGAQLDDQFHTCALFNSDEDEEAVILPFLREGLDAGERVILIVDPAQQEARRRRLEAAGLDVERLSASHQLEVLTWDDAYLKGGHFDQDVMLALVRATFAQSREMGFPRTRVVGSMEWRHLDVPGVEAMIEYEAHCNDVLADLKQPAICVYRTERMDARVLLDVIRTHPVVVLGRTLRENPFFVPPDEFLRDRRLVHATA